MADISDTLAPKSDQLDNIDLRGGPPRIFTVTKVDVRPGAEQPVSVHLAEFDRPWKPGKNMRRVLAYCWTKESGNWVGKRVELYADEKVKFGNETPGGTRISRLSHIDGTKHVPILVSQGRPGTYKVEPLPDVAPADRVTALRAEWKTADGERRKVIEAEVAALSSPQTSGAESAPETPSPDSVEQPPTSAPETPLCPECAQGKHQNCSGQAWDDAADEPGPCGCTDGEHAS